MTVPERLSARRFHESGGVEDWRDLGMGVCACFRTGSFDKGVALVDEIGRLADAMNHHPDVDLQYTTVTVRLFTHDIMAVSDLDAQLARQISEAARVLGIEANVAATQSVQLTLDAAVTENVRPFWRAVLDYKEVGDDDLIDPRGRGPSIWFQRMNPPRVERNRFHIDVFVPHDEAEARVAAALAAGGRLVDDKSAPDHWLLADAEGNEVDVATTFYRD